MAARTIVFKNYLKKPPEVLGRVRLEADGRVVWDAALDILKLERGIYNPDTRRRTMPEAGPWFLQEVLEKFGHGQAVRAKPEEPQ